MTAVPAFFADYQQRVHAELQRLVSPATSAVERAMAYTVLAPSKRVRAVLTLLCAELCGGNAGAGGPGRGGHRTGPRLVAHPRRSAGDGRRAAAARTNGEPPGVRRSDRDSRRVRPAQSRVRRRWRAPTSPPLAVAHDGAAVGRRRHRRPDRRAGARSAGDRSGRSTSKRSSGSIAARPARCSSRRRRRRARRRRRRPSRSRSLSAYAKNLGLAFQIIDDLLDVEGDPAETGKAVRADARKTTFVSFSGVDGARQLAAELCQTADRALAPFGRRADRLRELSAFVRRPRVG